MTALDEFAAEMAQHVAHTRGWSRREVTAWVELHIQYEREEYEQAGTPLGYSDTGFLF